MKKKALVITFILTIIMTMFSTAAVFAEEEDDYGADAHSSSMSMTEEDDTDYDDELSFKDMVINAVTENIKYVIGAVGGLIILIIVIKLIGGARSRREPKYKGRH